MIEKIDNLLEELQTNRESLNQFLSEYEEFAEKERSNVKYTVLVNDGEYADGLFNSKEEAGRYALNLYSYESDEDITFDDEWEYELMDTGFSVIEVKV